MTVGLSIAVLTKGHKQVLTVCLDVDESLKIQELRGQIKKNSKNELQLPPPPPDYRYVIDKLDLLNPANGDQISLGQGTKTTLSPANIITVVSGDNHPSNYEEGILNENDSLLEFMNIPYWNSSVYGDPHVGRLAQTSLSGEVPKNYNYKTSQWEEEEHADRFLRVFDSIDISFRRTLRMPDDGKTHFLPPDFGSFPLYNLEAYPEKFPQAIAEEGGVFLAMYQREAMFINFETKDRLDNFAIKISCGGVNAITGLVEGQEADVLDSDSGSRQDYIVLPEQKWMDGFCTQPGVVRQFVAMPLGSGYTVEGQKTLAEVKGGFEFQITPSYNRYLKSFSLEGASLENFKALDIFNSPKKLALEPGTRLEMREYHPTYLTYDSISDFLQHKRGDGKLHLELHVRLVDNAFLLCSGNKYSNRGSQMGLAPGGRIIQDIRKDSRDPRIWAVEHTRSIKVHILNCNYFEEITHMLPPCTNVTAEDYARIGLPFFYVEEEPEARVEGGQFEGVKSVANMDSFQLATAASTGKGDETPLKPKICGGCKEKLCDCVIRPCNHTFCNVCITGVVSVLEPVHAACPQCSGPIKRVVGFSAPMNLPGEKALRVNVPVRVWKKGPWNTEGRPVFESVVKMRF